jgi:hypothetical protein
MSGETKTEHKTVDWKKLEVANTGKTWQDLHNESVKLIKNHGINEHGEDQEHFSTGNTRGMAKARQIHDELRAWEKKKEKEGIINSKDRVHRQKLWGLGTRYIMVKEGDRFNKNQTTTIDGETPDVVKVGGKKRKTKRKKRKTKRKKKTRKRKRRRKTKERKRRKKRKTRKR